jgi:hypothetical protein
MCWSFCNQNESRYGNHLVISQKVEGEEGGGEGGEGEKEEAEREEE